MSRLPTPRAVIAACALLALAACGGGGGGSSETGDDGTTFKGRLGDDQIPDLLRLEIADVQQVINDGLAEANARGRDATIAVVDRVGNVLAVFQSNANGNLEAGLFAFARAQADGSGLDGLFVPGGAPAGAIAKAVTGAYLSSSGNAFSTRTASQIVQENFNPGELRQPGGPLFGVQFSSLPCSDLVNRSVAADAGVAFPQVGPRRTPLGLSADPGGLPLYKTDAQGVSVVVGGVGVMVDGVYGIDPEPLDTEAPAANIDEIVALAATRGFLPDEGITAPFITVEGKQLRYTDGGLRNNLGQIISARGGAGAPVGGTVIAVEGYFPPPGTTPSGTPLTAAAIQRGTAYGELASGYVDIANIRNGSLPGLVDPGYQSESVFLLTDKTGALRFSPRDATDAPRGDAANALTAQEVRQIIDEGLGVALAGRGQIRRPIESPIHVTVSVVDTLGNVLGLARTTDGPVFGTDVSLQKARSALFFSSGARSGGSFSARALLNAVPGLDSAAALSGVPGLAPSGLIPDTRPGGGPGQKVVLPPLSDYVTATEAFLAPAAAVLDGGFAYSDRGIGNIARPFYPDGINDNGPGPLSRTVAGPDTTVNWSPFSTGLQFDLVGADILLHVLSILNLVDDPVDECAEGLRPPGALGALSPLANGLQIFAGSVPIYRGDTLVGAVGVSGDGIDQDDMVAGLGLARAAAALQADPAYSPPRGPLANPPAAVRSDQLVPFGARLRYISCPFQPFRGSDAQNVCNAL